jgi:hypothetical protein
MLAEHTVQSPALRLGMSNPLAPTSRVECNRLVVNGGGRPIVLVLDEAEPTALPSPEGIENTRWYSGVVPHVEHKQLHNKLYLPIGQEPSAHLAKGSLLRMAPIMGPPLDVFDTVIMKNSITREAADGSVCSRRALSSLLSPRVGTRSTTPIELSMHARIAPLPKFVEQPLEMVQVSSLT